ncbi:AAA family ATPase [Nocardia mexicana]|uniref:Dynein-related subfamily AAA family protein n=1 Tax=Nocardia mexicana TaxID=279262 RepID=A0A370GZB8_9NOCA|nr:MoxR family ATPase [Nocardia mexicana]RDI48988.1 dynein-related subfamily AAA family protein [Nocardia mexicana]
MTAPSWHVFRGTSDPRPDAWDAVPPPMIARTFTGHPLLPFPQEQPDQPTQISRKLGRDGIGAHQLRSADLDVINAALLCRRPLLVTGAPGLGKSSLAYLIARELELGPILHWPITSRSVLRDGLYTYDALRRFEEAQIRRVREADDDAEGLADYITLGPLGTALLPYAKPRVLLIDEIDKADVDLPNDLLHVFENGEYQIDELRRIRAHRPEVEVFTHEGRERVGVREGFVQCSAFPVIVMTSNGEREFPPAFLRRCLQLRLERPERAQLERVVAAHLGGSVVDEYGDIIDTFIRRRSELGTLPTDRLLIALHVLTQATRADGAEVDRQRLAERLMQPTDTGG